MAKAGLIGARSMVQNAGLLSPSISAVNTVDGALQLAEWREQLGDMAQANAQIQARMEETPAAGAAAQPSTYTSFCCTTQPVQLPTHTEAKKYLVQAHTVTDDGDGRLAAGRGSVDYEGQTVYLRAIAKAIKKESYQADYEDAAAFEAATLAASNSSGAGSDGSQRRGGAYSSTAQKTSWLPDSNVRVEYRYGTPAETQHLSTHDLGNVVLHIAPTTNEPILPGSVQFTWGGKTYQDYEGVIYEGRTETTAGSRAGSINYGTGVVTLTNWTGGSAAAAPVLQSCYTYKEPWRTASLFFNTTQAPFRAGAGSFVLSVMNAAGEIVTASVDGQGNISGNNMRGHIDFARGGVQLMFGEYVNDNDLSDDEKMAWWYRTADVGAVHDGQIWRPWAVDPTTLRYSTVSYIYLPVDVSLMGIDPAALPSDGRVAFARPGDTCVIGRNIMGDPFTPSEGMTYNVGTPELSMIQVLDAETGEEVLEGYACDLAAGTVTLENTAGWPPQVRIFARQEVYRQISDVKIDGRVTLTQPVGVAFDAGSVFSTALRQGDRYARVKRIYDQQSWDGVTWKDGLDGNQATANYNTTNLPITVTNLGAITERWALRFRANGQEFDLIGQNLGQIAAGNINEDFSPQNYAVGAPYFTIKAAGWGSGWQAGNVLFLDTVGAEAAIDLVRCVQPSSPAGMDDSVLIVQRGDVDRPPATSFPQ